MLFIQWKTGLAVGKVHLASDRMRTLCGRPIPGDASNSNKSPRDKTKICKLCRDVEQYELRHRHVFEK